MYLSGEPILVKCSISFRVNSYTKLNREGISGVPKIPQISFCLAPHPHAQKKIWRIFPPKEHKRTHQSVYSKIPRASNAEL
jgi:hypothetical protein